jgi:predicted translin family RNA/ssDNA-binding protein
MLDKKDLEAIRRNIDAFEKERDFVIKQSRDVVKLSKKVIYALHRKDSAGAKKAVESMKKAFSELNTKCRTPKLRCGGSFKVAVQEFVEALCFYELMKSNRIPKNSQLKLDPEFYLMGLIDLTGELVRKAINSAISGDYKTSLNLKSLVSELYDELMLFDFAGGELRKKFDSVKYDLKKLDDLVLSLKLSDKI